MILVSHASAHHVSVYKGGFADCPGVRKKTAYLLRAAECWCTGGRKGLLSASPMPTKEGAEENKTSIGYRNTLLEGVKRPRKRKTLESGYCQGFF